MRSHILLASASVILSTATAASAQTLPESPPPAPPPPVLPPPAPRASTASTTVDVMTLRIMRDKGILTQAEYNSALRDLSDTSGAKASESNSLVIGKWSATLYGFAEADYDFDSTQSYTDFAASGQVAHLGTYAASHPRSQFGIRNSRLGFRFRAPEYHAIRASAQIETDFLGDWASPTYVGATGQPSENQYFTSPALRLRHAFLKVETKVVDVIFGQTWHLFGWQSIYNPDTVQIQGVPGELYARTPQLRLSKTFSNKDVTFDIALGAMRPPQRDSALPEGEAGLHFAINRWTGVQTVGATGTTVSPASIAVTGDVRGFAVANYPTGGTVAARSLKSTYDVQKTGGGPRGRRLHPADPGLGGSPGQLAVVPWRVRLRPGDRRPVLGAYLRPRHSRARARAGRLHGGSRIDHRLQPPDRSRPRHGRRKRERDSHRVADGTSGAPVHATRARRADVDLR